MITPTRKGDHARSKNTPISHEETGRGYVSSGTGALKISPLPGDGVRIVITDPSWCITFRITGGVVGPLNFATTVVSRLTDIGWGAVGV
ncbi:hypothetical protein ACGFNP_15370 [Nonomuraea sp. NPDC049269]|uniref:hypothetical protein n=1 Tax=Nonomuraea sp. NPDC049269 TaxID=3364349 RepID=UPI003719409B